MTGFERASSYGEAIFAGPGYGPLWRHACGRIAWVDLLADDGPRQPWEQECEGCQGRRRGDWAPLFTYTGPLCDQCSGNGWVPISGKVDGALCGYDTVAECTACGASGIATAAQLPGTPSSRPAPVGSWWQTADGAAYVDGDYLDGPGDQVITYVLHRPDGGRAYGKWGGREFADAYTRLDGPPAWLAANLLTDEKENSR